MPFLKKMPVFNNFWPQGQIWLLWELRIIKDRPPILGPKSRVLQKKLIFFIFLRFWHLHLPADKRHILMVERRCDKCRHFRQGSVGSTRAEHVWGDCMKPKEHSGDAQDTETQRFFTWADNSCEDFEPRVAPVEKSEKEFQAY